MSDMPQDVEVLNHGAPEPRSNQQVVQVMSLVVWSGKSMRQLCCCFGATL